MPIDWSKAKYRENERQWLLSLSGEEVRNLWGESSAQQVSRSLFMSKRLFWNSLGIDIAGTPESYHAAYQPVIEETVRQLPVLVQQAEEYLKAFIDLNKANNSDGGLFVQRISCGTWKQDWDVEPLNQIEISFTLNEDPYGWWVVRFSYNGKENKFTPFYFSREQT